MSFLIANFRRPLRILLDDWDSSVPQRYPNTVLDDAVRCAVTLGKLNNSIYSTAAGYTLTPDESGIDPDWSGVPTGYNLFALGTYQSALMFLDNQRSRYSYKTRPISESFGDFYRTIAKMEAEIARLENGDGGFSGYQSYYSWIGGVAGLPLGEVLAQFDVQSPLWKATFTRDGMRVA